MEFIERQSYKNADFITVLSEGGIDYITKRGGDSSKIEHVYNGCSIYDSKRANMWDFKKIEGIEDKVLISYAGILSPFQGIDNILNAAKELQDHKDIIFYLIGDGIIKDHLARRIRDECISNVKLLPLQPRDKYLNIINSSDISLVSLDERMKAPCIPGKILNLMAAGQPLLAVVPNDCETAKLFISSNSGIIVAPGNIEELTNVILKMKDNPLILKELGDNGKRFFEKNMNLDKNIIVYEKIFNHIVNNIK